MRRVLRLTPVLPVEGAAIGDCFGRVLAEDLVAPRDLPPWPASAVDGYAVRAADAGMRLRVVGESAAGHPFGGALEPGTAARILTGGVLPGGRRRGGDGRGHRRLDGDLRQRPHVASPRAPTSISRART